MPTFTESDVINAAFKALGSISETEYSTSDRQDALRRALLEFSQYRPLRKIGSFNTEIDRQVYDLGSSYSYLLSITDVYYGPGDSPDLSLYYNTLTDEYLNAFAGINTLNHEALRVIDNRTLSLVQSGQRWNFKRVDDNNVALIPTPTKVQTIYFTYSLIKTFNDLREQDYQDIVNFVIMIAGSGIISDRNKRPLQMNTPDIGFIMFHSTKSIEKILESTGKTLKNKFGVSSFITHG
jgi:hypothetical protein